MEVSGKESGVSGLAAAVEVANGSPAASVPKLPDKKFRAGGLTATVWKGVSQKGATYYNVQLGKSYKDKADGSWKTTSSLRENEVPKAMVLLQKAYEYVITQQTNANFA